MNAGLGDAADEQHLGQPVQADNDAMTGLQDNGTLMFTGTKTWELPLTGDGCDSGFDATDPHFRFHTYTNGQMDINYDDFDQNTWLWIGDRFVVNFPESAPLLLTDRLRSGADEDDLRRRAERLADVERRRRPRLPGGALQRDHHPRQGPEQPACSPGLVARLPTGRSSARRR